MVSGYAHGDVHYDATCLYVTKKGNFFMARSRWAQSAGQNSWTGGSGLRPIDKDGARQLLEEHGVPEQVEQYFPNFYSQSD